jgi:hypothetical protein
MACVHEVSKHKKAERPFEGRVFHLSCLDSVALAELCEDWWVFWEDG